jgi:hypothetical protein
MNPIKNKYYTQKACAKRRDILFLLTFDDWWNMWQQSGKWHQRGCRKGQYVMSRYNDHGVYEIGNVFIQLNSENIKQAQLGNNRSHGPMSDEHKKNLSIARTGLKLSCVSKLKGKPQSEEHKMKNKLAQLKRYANKQYEENVR